jgi:cytochrome c biogenesis protein ResB
MIYPDIDRYLLISIVRMKNMKFGMILIIIVLVAALIGTLALTGKPDEDYKGSTKQNTLRLTAIYIIVILASIGGLAWYISMK